MTSSLPGAVEPTAVVAMAQHALQIEAQALQDLSARLGEHSGEAFVKAVQAILACKGRLVVMGMGKSGHVGRKIAATMASTGTPAMFVHPAEAHHGDLGMVTRIDVVLAISNSGESEELTALLPVLKRQGVPLIAMTGKAQSSLARHSDIVLDCAVDKEACPLNLAPTASTTTQMALGDALAVALLELRGFKAEDFARSHPGGALGRKLLTHLRDVMRSGDALPKVGPDTSFSDLMREMSAKGLGAAVVVGAGNKVLGVFTDGDLRRCWPTRSASTTVTCSTSAWCRHWRWCTSVFRPTPSPNGRWLTRTAWSPTTAKSTRSRATSTGCAPVKA